MGVKVAVGVLVAVGVEVTVGVAVGVGGGGIVDGRAVTREAASNMAPTMPNSTRLALTKRETGASWSKSRETVRLTAPGANSADRNSATLSGRSSGCMAKLHIMAWSVCEDTDGARLRGERIDLGLRNRCFASRGG
jgi:hypothetical protein